MNTDNRSWRMRPLCTCSRGYVMRMHRGGGGKEHAVRLWSHWGVLFLCKEDVLLLLESELR